MTEDEQAHYDAGKRTQIWGDNPTNSTQLATIDDYPDWRSKLDAVLIEIELAAKTQQEDNSGVAEDKDSLETILIDSVMKYSLRAKTFAKKLNNKSLLAGLSHPVTYYAGTGDELVSKTTAVKELMKTNLLKLTVLKAADITEIETNITAFMGIKDLPTTARQEKKSEGTDLMEPLMVRLDDAMESIGDLSHSYFPDTVMTANFDLTSKLIHHGRHNILEVHFADENGNAINGGVLSDVNSSKSATAE